MMHEQDVHRDLSSAICGRQPRARSLMVRAASLTMMITLACCTLSCGGGSNSESEGATDSSDTPNRATDTQSSSTSTDSGDDTAERTNDDTQAHIASPPAHDSQPFVIESLADSWRITYTIIEHTSVPTNELFDLHVEIEPITTDNQADGDDVDSSDNADEPCDDPSFTFDAAMPHHGHGMNVEPVVEQINNASFEVRGVLMHMIGRWELYFDITCRGITERAQATVELQ